MATVTVIIPSYNHASFLSQRIDSILEQTFQDFEVMILDDCSTDGSRDVIERYRGHSKVSVIKYNEENSGSPFCQWKLGIEKARGKYIWIAESDDFAEPTFLEKLLALANQFEDVGIVFSNSNWVNEKGEVGQSLSIYNESFFREGRREISSLLRYNTIQNGSAALIKSELAKKVSKDLEKFRACGDWFFYIKILSEGNLCYTSEPLNNFRWYHNNTSNFAKENDHWLAEGIMMLSLLRPEFISVDKNELFLVTRYWLLKLLRSNKLKCGLKIRLLGRLVVFYCRFL